MRDNEMSRVAAVREHAQRGDTQAMIASLIGLWLQPQERPDETDSAHAEAWHAISLANAVDAATAAGMQVLRDGKLIRPSAFIDLSESVSKEALLELAHLGMAQRWRAFPYLAAVLMRLIEQNHKAELAALLEQYGTTLGETPDGWLLVGFVLTTSYVGTDQQVSRWFEGFEHREALPTWIVAAYVATISQKDLSIARLSNYNLKRIFELARLACERCTWDEGAAPLVYFAAIGALRDARDDEFVALLARHGEFLGQARKRPLLEHPITRYANALKHQHRITDEALAYRRYHGTSRGGALQHAIEYRGKVRPVDMQLIEVLQELADFVAVAAPLVEQVPPMIELKRGDPRAIDLMKRMAKSRPGRLPWLQPAWRRLVKARVSWGHRALYALRDLF
jgi:hypothetical protein